MIEVELIKIKEEPMEINKITSGEINELNSELNKKIQFPNVWGQNQVQPFNSKLLISLYSKTLELIEKVSELTLRVESLNKSVDRAIEVDGKDGDYIKPDKNLYLDENGKLKMGEYLAACRAAKKESK